MLKLSSALLDIAECWARMTGFESISVVSARLNFWTSFSNLQGGVHLPMDRAFQIYDLTAERAGYLFNSETSHWKKRL